MQISLSKLYTAPAVIRGLQTLSFIRFEKIVQVLLARPAPPPFFVCRKSSQLRLHIYVIEGGVYGLGHYYAK